KMETELWNNARVKAGHAAYTDRFHELERLVPHLVTIESRKIKRGRAFMLGVEETRHDPNIVTGIEPNELGFRYKIELATGKLVKIDKAKIICHEKVVRIPLLDGKVLRVLGERPKEKARLLMSAKASDKKQEEIVMVRDFPEVFLDDLSGLPHVQEIKF
nr:putative reverse transcriptase domain-containing protein [Tanacetum cinerariifolium]